MQKEIESARLQVQGTIEDIKHAYSSGALARWSAICAVVALVAFGCGFWAGKS